MVDKSAEAQSPPLARWESSESRMPGECQLEVPFFSLDRCLKLQGPSSTAFILLYKVTRSVSTTVSAVSMIRGLQATRAPTNLPPSFLSGTTAQGGPWPSQEAFSGQPSSC
ncbi:hypothetical protein TNCV_1444821 [Trichonephila clavipes]|nr:hypothetical protein TNCV_1444821 [Trichonephila clavipes]